MVVAQWSRLAPEDLTLNPAISIFSVNNISLQLIEEKTKTNKKGPEIEVFYLKLQVRWGHFSIKNISAIANNLIHVQSTMHFVGKYDPKRIKALE